MVDAQLLSRRFISSKMPANLSNKAIEEFQAIYEKKFGEKLSRDEATDAAQQASKDDKSLIINHENNDLR